MRGDFLLKMAEFYELATAKRHGYGLRDAPTAEPNFIMWKVIGLNEFGELITANIYAKSKEEAKENYEMIYSGSIVKEVSIAKDLLK